MINLENNDWKVVDRPGYFGSSREAIHAGFDEKHGSGNWKLAWQWGNEILQRSMALQIYEDAYYHYFIDNPKVLDWLVKTASDVYDTAESNVESGFNYDLQETPVLGNHIHDIAIRRAVLRNGAQFNKEGDLFEVRPGGKGEKLGPQYIPFHRSDMIYQGVVKYKGKERDFKENPPWWRQIGIPNSVEEFYQQNKVLLARTQKKFEF